MSSDFFSYAFQALKRQRRTCLWSVNFSELSRGEWLAQLRHEKFCALSPTLLFSRSRAGLGENIREQWTGPRLTSTLRKWRYIVEGKKRVNQSSGEMWLHALLQKIEKYLLYRMTNFIICLFVNFFFFIFSWRSVFSNIFFYSIVFLFYLSLLFILLLLLFILLFSLLSRLFIVF